MTEPDISAIQARVDGAMTLERFIDQFAQGVQPLQPRLCREARRALSSLESDLNSSRAALERVRRLAEEWEGIGEVGGGWVPSGAIASWFAAYELLTALDPVSDAKGEM